MVSAATPREIVRLDQDKMYSVDNKKKTYTETTFAETRAQMEKVIEADAGSAGVAAARHLRCR